MKLKQKFKDEDLQRIKNAVKEAEKNISGEIVPVIVERSDNYLLSSYKGSLIVATVVFFTMVIIDRYILVDAATTLYYDPVFIFFVVVLGGETFATKSKVNGRMHASARGERIPRRRSVQYPPPYWHYDFYLIFRT